MSGMVSDFRPDSLRDPSALGTQEHKPNEDGSCKTPLCEGNVVAKATGMCGDEYLTDIPFCDECKRSYMYAEHATIIGIDELIVK